MTSIDNLADEIMKGLTEYADLAETEMKKAVKKTATQFERLGGLGDYRDETKRYLTLDKKFEAKQIEANATLAGFNDIQTKKYSYKNEKTGKKINTLSISFIKPDKKC